MRSAERTNKNQNGGTMKKTAVMRELLNKKGLIVAPAAYDCLSAMIVESVGFPAVFVSGFCLAASRLGMPDLGLEGRTLTVDQARSIAASVDIPVLVDAGTGYRGRPGRLSYREGVDQGRRCGLLHRRPDISPRMPAHRSPESDTRGRLHP